MRVLATQARETGRDQVTPLRRQLDLSAGVRPTHRYLAGLVRQGLERALQFLDCLGGGWTTRQKAGKKSPGFLNKGLEVRLSRTLILDELADILCWSILRRRSFLAARPQES